MHSTACLVPFILDAKKKLADGFTQPQHQSPLIGTVRSVINDFTTFKKVQYKYKKRLRNTPIYHKFGKVKKLMAQLGTMDIPGLFMCVPKESEPQAMVDHLYLLRAVSMWLSKAIDDLCSAGLSSLFYIHNLYVLQYNLLQISIDARIFQVFCTLYTHCRLEYSRFLESLSGIAGTISYGEGYALFGALPIEIEEKQFKQPT